MENMIKVSIIHVVSGTFFSEDGKEYEISGAYNTRILAKEVGTENEVQFSSYGDVYITKDQAKRTLSFLDDVLKRTRSSLCEYEQSIKSITEQGVEL